MRGKKRRALEVLHTALVFREQAFDIVDQYLFPKWLNLSKGLNIR